MIARTLDVSTPEKELQREKVALTSYQPAVNGSKKLE